MPKVAKVTIEACSIPVDLYIPGVPLFSPRWWIAVTKTDAFWIALDKHMSATTADKRIKVVSNMEIQTDVESIARSKLQKRREKKAMSRTPSSSVPARTPEAGDEDSFNVEADFEEEIRELGGAATEDEDELPRASKRPRRTTRKLPVAKVECYQCDHIDTWEHMDLDVDSNPICFKCRDGEEDQSDDTVIVEVPLLSASPVEPPETFQETTVNQPTSTTVKIEEEIDPEDPDELTIIASTSGHKRQREDTAREVTIGGQNYLVLLAADGNAQLVRLEGQPDRKVKVEAGD